LGIAILICAFLYYLQKQKLSFSARVFTALALGIIVGGSFHTFYGVDSAVITSTNAYLDIIGGGYVKLLQMIVMPLILVSIIGVILKLKGAHSVGKISAITISTLMLTTMVAAAVGILMAQLFGLTAVGLTATAAEVARGQYLQSSFENFVNVAQALVLRTVSMVLRLTPYGVFALMTQLVAQTSYADIIKLGSFVLASYSAIFIMFAVHLAIIASTGLNPIHYVKEILPVLVFAFTSRTSVGSIPMNIQTQTQRLGTSEAIANFSASFGSTMGQNGCADAELDVIDTRLVSSHGPVSKVIPL
jgi:uncharacterized protein